MGLALVLALASVGRPFPWGVGIYRDPPGMQAMRLRGGQAPAPLVLRLRTKDGIKRLTLRRGERTSVEQLQAAIHNECKVAAEKQKLCRADGDQNSLDLTDGKRTLAELGVQHGAVLQLTVSGPSDEKPIARSGEGAGGKGSGPTNSVARRSRRRGESMQAYLDKRAEREVVLKAPPAATCTFCSIDSRVSKKL